MKRRIIETIAWVGLLLLCCMVWARAGIIVGSPNGQLEDWGVTPFSDWVPDSPLVAYAQGNNITNPGYGGERYDIEALYVYVAPDRIDFALVTSYSMALDEGWSYEAQAAGYNPYPTIPIDVEGGPDWEYALVIDPSGAGTGSGSAAVTLYRVNDPDAAWLYGHDYGTTGPVALRDDADLTLISSSAAGWVVTDNGATPGNTIEPFGYTGTYPSGHWDYGWSESNFFGQPYTWIYEASVTILDEYHLPAGADYTALNSMWCGNDYLVTPANAYQVTPEPGSLLLCATGLSGLGLGWWRRRKSRA
jgi:hypothetical protein